MITTSTTPSNPGNSNIVSNKILSSIERSPLAPVFRAIALFAIALKESSTKVSDTFAMIGTIFLWLFWPSFNGALAVGNSQHRVVINTILSLTSSCMSSFAVSKYLNKKFDMVDIQNASLAGGVAVGSSADLVIGPSISMLIGMISGIISTIGYNKLQPFIERKFKIHDTCGVNNLHGIPGIIGGLSGAISASFTSNELYGDNIQNIFHCHLHWI